MLPARDGSGFPGATSKPWAAEAPEALRTSPHPLRVWGLQWKTVLSGGGQQTLLKKQLAPSGPRDRTYSASQWALSGPSFLPFQVRRTARHQGSRQQSLQMAP